MNNVLIDLSSDDLSEVELLLRLGGIVICLRGKVMRILRSHQVKVMNLDVFNDLGALYTITVLEEGLQDTAAVMLETQLVVLSTDQLEAFFNNRMLLIISDLGLLLLDQKLVVIDLYIIALRHLSPLL